MSDNTVSISENGPYGVRGDLDVAGKACEEAWLCRCGQSKNKPYCDGSHKAAGFVDSGEPNPQGTGADGATGPLKLSFAKNGPILVNGAFRIVSATGRVVASTSKGALCRCGASQNKPFCDGSHTKSGFEGD